MKNILIMLVYISVWRVVVIAKVKNILSISFHILQELCGFQLDCFKKDSHIVV